MASCLCPKGLQLTIYTLHVDASKVYTSQFTELNPTKLGQYVQLKWRRASTSSPCAGTGWAFTIFTSFTPFTSFTLHMPLRFTLQMPSWFTPSACNLHFTLMLSNSHHQVLDRVQGIPPPVVKCPLTLHMPMTVYTFTLHMPMMVYTFTLRLCLKGLHLTDLRFHTYASKVYT